MTTHQEIIQKVNPQWLTFLIQQNAQIENNCITHFGDQNAEQRAALNNDVLCELTHLGAIAAHGVEAQSFLQNQLSNDVNQVSGQYSQLNAYCTAKGRALALMRLFIINDHYFLQMPVERVDAILKRLQMFVLRSKVNLTDASEQLVAFGLAGANAERILTSISSVVPQQVNQCVTSGTLHLCKIQGTQPRYMIFGNVDSAIAAWKQLQTHTVMCSHNVWRHLDIVAGVPQIYQANVEAFVPQMLNLHSIDGISFNKGCYPGQEIVARMHYLGKLKRRMYLTHVQNPPRTPQAGDLIFATDDQSNEGIGRVVDAQPNPDGGFDLLSVLQIASIEAGAVHLHSPDGPELTIQDLPYTVVLERQDAKSNT